MRTKRPCAATGIALALAASVPWMSTGAEIRDAGPGQALPRVFRSEAQGPGAYRDGVPPQLVEAWQEAARFAGVPKEQVYFVDEGHPPAGHYRFVYPPFFDQSDACTIVVPECRVEDAPFAHPWRPDSGPPARRRLSFEELVAVGERFLADYLKLDLAEFRLETSKPERLPRQLMLVWPHYKQDVRLLDSAAATVDSWTGGVVSFSYRRHPVEVSLTPRLSAGEAIARARAATRWEEPTTCTLRLTTARAEDSGKLRQVLAWYVTWPQRHVILDATSGAVLDTWSAGGYREAPPEVWSTPQDFSDAPGVGPERTRRMAPVTRAVRDVLAEWSGAEWLPGPTTPVTWIESPDGRGHAGLISYVHRGTQIDVRLDGTPSEVSSFTARVTAKRGTGLLRLPAEGDDFALLMALRGTLLSFPGIPAGGVGDHYWWVPWDVPPPVMDDVSFSETGMLAGLPGGKTVPVYETEGRRWGRLYAWVVPGAPVQIYLRH